MWIVVCKNVLKAVGFGATRLCDLLRLHRHAFRHYGGRGSCAVHRFLSNTHWPGSGCSGPCWRRAGLPPPGWGTPLRRKATGTVTFQLRVRVSVHLKPSVTFTFSVTLVERPGVGQTGSRLPLLSGSRPRRKDRRNPEAWWDSHPGGRWAGSWWWRGWAGGAGSQNTPHSVRRRRC